MSSRNYDDQFWQDPDFYMKAVDTLPGTISKWWDLFEPSRTQDAPDITNVYQTQQGSFLGTTEGKIVLYGGLGLLLLFVLILVIVLMK
ncbi:hypothetical protein [Aureispira sp. CCB-E]|uniref:hypothetical protein n=1 Tax=Aureispira sp. CCB-E TaxID=3051121 RepID=UPI0028691A3A|nr:hypothetical protein [Aureispira sp. CCB-E]WMX17490.1 hypothetical protein QP953_14000 [Aureispira sp. CCB-E]